MNHDATFQKLRARNHATPDRPVAPASGAARRPGDSAPRPHAQKSPEQTRRHHAGDHRRQRPHAGQALRLSPRGTGRAHRGRVGAGTARRTGATERSGATIGRRPLRRLLADRQGLPHAQRPADRGRWFRPQDPQGRVHLGHRPLGLWQVHRALDDGRPDRHHRRRDRARRARGGRRRARPRPGVPGAQPGALAQRIRQRDAGRGARVPARHRGRARATPWATT